MTEAQTKKIVKALNKAAEKVLGPQREPLIFDRGDYIILNMESGEPLLDYWNVNSSDTLIEIANESGLDGFFENETAGAAIWWGPVN